MNMDKSVRDLATGLIGYDETDCCKESVCSADDVGNIAGQIIKEMGGTAFVMGAAETVLHNAAKFLPENKKYQFAVKVARGAIPAYMMGRQLCHSVMKVWKRNRRQPLTPYEKRKRKIAAILETEEVELACHTMNFGSHIGDWLSSMPDNNIFRTISVLRGGNYNDEGADKEVDSISKDGYYYMTAEIDGKKSIVVINRHTTRFTETVGYNIDVWQKWDNEAMEIRQAIVMAFISDFNIRENTIHCTTLSLEARPRQKVKFPVYQCAPDFVKEVKRALKMKERRTYALVGEAGCGKTTSLLAIIDKFRDVPVITTNCKNINNVIGAYLTAQAAAPCLVVLEDIDQMELHDKSSKDLGILIGILDSSYDMSQGIVTIMTLNEPQNVHPCLMSRRGRIDRVMHFGPPKTIKEIREVMNNCSREVFGRKEHWISSSRHIDLLQSIVDSRLTHSDIRELVNWCKLNSEKGRPTPADIKNAFDTLMDSINNVNKFVNRTIPVSPATGAAATDDYPLVPQPYSAEDRMLDAVADIILEQGT